MEGIPPIVSVLLAAAWLGPIIALFYRKVPARPSLVFATVYFVVLWGAGVLASLTGHMAVVVLVLAAVIAGAWWKAFRM